MRDLISSISLALVGLAIVLEASRPLTAPPKVTGPSMAYYVALNGRDNWSGKLPSPNAQATDGPFATLERARDAIRALKQAGPLGEGGITVWIRGGRYYRDRTFELTAEEAVGRPDAIYGGAERDAGFTLFSQQSSFDLFLSDAP